MNNTNILSKTVANVCTDSVGEFEELVLLSVLNMNSNAYGVSIANFIESETGRRIAPGALYNTLSRLEKKKFLSSEFGEATEIRGGRRKRYYKVETAGILALKKTISTRSKLIKNLMPLLI